VRFNLSPASRVPLYLNSMAVMPVYARSSKPADRGWLYRLSLSPSPVPRVDILEALAPGIAFKAQRVHHGLTLPYSRFFTLASEAKFETPVPEKGGVGVALSFNLPELRSLVRVGAEVNFSPVQTASCFVKTKPWCRV